MILKHKHVGNWIVRYSDTFSTSNSDISIHQIDSNPSYKHSFRGLRLIGVLMKLGVI
jgi:hypothetical protein